MYDNLIKRLRECTAEQNGEKTLWHQAADAIQELQKRKRGKWARGWDHRNGFDYAYETCSECGYKVDVCGYNYCPNCGAQMESGSE